MPLLHLLLCEKQHILSGYEFYFYFNDTQKSPRYFNDRDPEGESNSSINFSVIFRENVLIAWRLQPALFTGDSSTSLLFLIVLNVKCLHSLLLKKIEFFFLHYFHWCQLAIASIAIVVVIVDQ